LLSCTLIHFLVLILRYVLHGVHLLIFSQCLRTIDDYQGIALAYILSLFYKKGIDTPR